MRISEVYNEDNMIGMSRFPDKFFGVAIDDPPYFNGPNKLGYYGKGYSSIGIKRDTYDKVGRWDVPGSEYFLEVKRTCRDWIFWGANYYDALVGEAFPSPKVDQFDSFLKENPTGWILWDKVNYTSTFADCELAFTSFDRPTQVFRFMWNGMLQGKSIQQGHIMQGNKRLNEKRIHPTQKPVSLYKWAISNYCNSGDKISDFHMGSQSSRIAAYDLGYDYWGWEISDQLFSSGNKRFNRHKSQLSIF